MLNQIQEKLWQEYLEHEEVRIRSVSLEALNKFIAALENDPIELWSEWVYDLCGQIVDEGSNIPVRFPLFRRILFPALFIGYEQSRAGCARWLAGFSQLLYKSPECRAQLGEDNFSNKSLLYVALEHDPNDYASRGKLISIISGEFDYALHELPSGVLYGYNGANIEQCKELEEQLNEFQVLLKIANLEDRYVDLVGDCRTHFIAYRNYLQKSSEFSCYEEYLNFYGIKY